ncbi:hypothetical protein V6N11_025598 [Hibiscus sabdariffa]|uniref:Uncharacterized protein n=1 Tax=Hibiscus sabdariffa TaxID=183260 RepID=A0ABR2ST53_9ROSI
MSTPLLPPTFSSLLFSSNLFGLRLQCLLPLQTQDFSRLFFHKSEFRDEIDKIELMKLIYLPETSFPGVSSDDISRQTQLITELSKKAQNLQEFRWVPL